MARPEGNMLCADFHGFSLRELKTAIDYDLDSANKEKDINESRTL